MNSSVYQLNLAVSTLSVHSSVRSPSSQFVFLALRDMSSESLARRTSYQRLPEHGDAKFETSTETLPSFLAGSNYQNITDNSRTVHHKAWDTDVSAFTWLSQHPERFSDFNLYMAAQHRTARSWLSVYPLGEEIQEWQPSDTPVFVDVGGGIGHQCAEVIAQYPELSGRIALQDLANCIDEALPTPGVDKIVHDIYDPQPIKGNPSSFLNQLPRLILRRSSRRKILLYAICPACPPGPQLP